MEKLLFFFFLLLILNSCDTTSDSGSRKLYLLQNSVFDSSGFPSLSGWIYEGAYESDTVPVFFKDTPPGSNAKYSVSLAPGHIPTTEMLYRYFTGLTSGIYRLSLWARTIGYGEFGLSLKKPPNQYYFSDSSGIVNGVVNDGMWHENFLLDTLVLKTSDTLFILLNGGTTEIASWGVVYDNITLEKVQ